MVPNHQVHRSSPTSARAMRKTRMAGADDLYREIRIGKTLKDENGGEVPAVIAC